MKSTTFDKVVRKGGNSLALNVTKELKLLGVQPDDVVRITIEVLED